MPCTGPADGPVKPDHDSGGVRPHQIPRPPVPAPVDVKERLAKLARGCGRLLAHACASVHTSFFGVRSTNARAGGLLAPRTTGP